MACPCAVRKRRRLEAPLFQDASRLLRSMASMRGFLPMKSMNCRMGGTAYPFSRNPSFAQDKIRSETPSIGFVKLTFLLITVLYNAVININRFLFVVKYGNCQGRFFKYAFCFHLEWIPAPC